MVYNQICKDNSLKKGEEMKIGTVKRYMNAGLNIMIAGPAGTGKTAVLKEAADSLGWKMKYYSAATLDAQADLLGIPVPNKDGKHLDYYRPMDIDDADVVFFDEINRTDDRTIAAIFEITQFRTVNGNPLPNLKSVCVALNPAEEGYNVRELDLAFIDRFDLYIEAQPEFNYGYFSKVFGSNVSNVAKSWWEDYHDAYKRSLTRENSAMSYISPRRMEKMLSIHAMFKTVSSLRDSLPLGTTANVSQLHSHLLKAYRGVSTVISDRDANADAERILNETGRFKRRDSNAKFIMDTLNDDSLDPGMKRKLQQDMAIALSRDVGAARLIKVWIDFLVDLPSPIFASMTVNWNVQKRAKVEYAMQRRLKS